jgi:hypothetical protein
MREGVSRRVILGSSLLLPAAAYLFGREKKSELVFEGFESSYGELFPERFNPDAWVDYGKRYKSDEKFYGRISLTPDCTEGRQALMLDAAGSLARASRTLLCPHDNLGYEFTCNAKDLGKDSWAIILDDNGFLSEIEMSDGRFHYKGPQGPVEGTSIVPGHMRFHAFRIAASRSYTDNSDDWPRLCQKTSFFIDGKKQPRDYLRTITLPYPGAWPPIRLVLEAEKDGKFVIDDVKFELV